MRHLFTPLVALCLSVAFVTVASADLVSGRCQNEIENEIASLAILKERIKDVSILNIYDGNGVGGGRIDHIEGWVSFNDCKGNLVISVNNACLLEQVYTTYECRVPGVKSY
ncbi:hypothetical protein [Sneathiella sp.]|uniref:hypothetical protein n=1 Tax=Sneathiella sp. TaxID=1964365 RepID=UPI002611CC49|nr:hypothetical protein [Sneathiella sp.]MDF2367175.1 hypothetical protein [Sneathiella sp.]